MDPARAREASPQPARAQGEPAPSPCLQPSGLSALECRGLATWKPMLTLLRRHRAIPHGGRTILGFHQQHPGLPTSCILVNTLFFCFIVAIGNPTGRKRYLSLVTLS